MASLRVNALLLTLRAPAARRAAGSALRAQAEQAFVPAVLEAMHRRLEELFGPEAVIRIRRLCLRLSMSPDGLSPGRLAETVGRDLADQVEQLAPRRPLAAALRTPAAEVQVFRNRAHLQAVELAAAAARRKGPDGKARDFGRLWRRLMGSPPGEQIRVLEMCARAGTLEQVLVRLGPADGPALARLAGLLAPEAVVRALAQTRARVRSAESADPVAEPPGASDERAARAPEVSQAVRTPDAPASRASLDRAIDPGGRSVAGDVSSSPIGADAIDTPSAGPQQLGEPRSAADSPPSSEAESAAAHAAAPPLPAAHRAPPSDSVAAATRPGVPAERCGDTAPRCHATQWGPLLYLLNISLKLELPERLWRVGIDEGLALSAMLARLSGTADDPASGVLRADFPNPPAALPNLPEWARRELVEQTHADAERRALAPGLIARIDQLRGWYAADTSWALPDWGAALHLAVVEDLLETRIGPAGLAERFGQRGRIAVTEEEIRLELPMSAVDMDLRRAGLDADPGWLPWLDKRLVFHFEAHEP